LQPGESTLLPFQWDEPFASAGGKGASSDLDLFVFDAENNLIDLNTESNLGTDAYEVLPLQNNTDQAVEYQLAIGYNSAAGGQEPNSLALGLGGEDVSAEYATPSSTIVGNHNTSNSVAVGAADYSQTPEFGTDSAQLESFSSIGNTPILFDDQGNRLSEAEIRQKPEIVAPDGTNTTFFQEGIDTEGDGFPNFSGTSAASPHAAGVAALLLEANPNATPDQVYQALEISALDMDNPYTQGFDQGYDPATGYGFIQADRALDEILGISNTDIASSSSQEAFI
jgi:subtilisin family serine protease